MASRGAICGANPSYPAPRGEYGEAARAGARRHRGAAERCAPRVRLRRRRSWCPAERHYLRETIPAGAGAPEGRREGVATAQPPGRRAAHPAHERDARPAPRPVPGDPRRRAHHGTGRTPGTWRSTSGVAPTREACAGGGCRSTRSSSSIRRRSRRQSLTRRRPSRPRGSLPKLRRGDHRADRGGEHPGARRLRRRRRRASVGTARGRRKLPGAHQRRPVADRARVPGAGRVVRGPLPPVPPRRDGADDADERRAGHRDGRRRPAHPGSGVRVVRADHRTRRVALRLPAQLRQPGPALADVPAVHARRRDPPGPPAAARPTGRRRAADEPAELASLGGDADKIVLGGVLAVVLLASPTGLVGVWHSAVRRVREPRR